MEFDPIKIVFWSALGTAVVWFVKANFDAVVKALGLDRLALNFARGAGRLSGLVVAQPWFWPSLWMLFSALLASISTVAILLALGIINVT